MKAYRQYAPMQSFLLPPSPRDWLPASHLLYFVEGFVARLNLRAIEDRIHASRPGGPSGTRS
ncbi:MAG: hypothetical protein H6709_18020 [Kofleriaceae bacterium]|nr:hypothetical protein [Myxococcales bacterium]MCB9559722.1 hypothetical protein [Kofleriaceae bacterium]MCB9573982.1 hypothetical protein [Kofleriaceae bacterium]